MRHENNTHNLTQYEESMIKEFEKRNSSHLKRENDLSEIFSDELKNMIPKKKMLLLKTDEFEVFLHETNKEKISKPKILDYDEFMNFFEKMS